MLIWNQYEFIECLEVLPEIEEYETSHSFQVGKDGLRLDLAVFQYSGDIFIDLYRDGIEASIFQMRLIDCPGARYVKNKTGTEYLEFAAAKSFGSRYDGESPPKTGVRITVNPNLRIELF